MTKILIADDESDIREVVKVYGELNGYEVDEASDGIQALDMIKENSYDLVILDVMMPKKDGFAVIKEMRSRGISTPVIFLTARDSIEDRVTGLDLGANDYLVKPFKFIELVARIKSLLRRSGHVNGSESNEIDDENTYQFSDLTVNDYTKKVTRSGAEISLTSTEYKLLLYFMNNPEKVISRAEILEAVWGVNYELGTNVVDVYVNYLRKKLDTQDDDKLIHTVIGMGYVLKKS